MQRLKIKGVESTTFYYNAIQDWSLLRSYPSLIYNCLRKKINGTCTYGRTGKMWTFCIS